MVNSNPCFRASLQKPMGDVTDAARMCMDGRMAGLPNS